MRLVKKFIDSEIKKASEDRDLNVDSVRYIEKNPSSADKVGSKKSMVKAANKANERKRKLLKIKKLIS